MRYQYVHTRPKTVLTRLPVYLFLKLNLWLSSLSIVLVGITAYALEIPFESIGLGFCLPPLLLYFIYVEDRRSASPEDWTNQPRRTALVTEYSTQLLITEVIVLVAYELLIFYYVLASAEKSAWFLLLGQLPFLILALYDRLKTFSGGDSLAVGGTWAYIVVFAILVSTEQVVTPPLVVAFLGWFLIVFGGVESRNVQDISGDVSANKTTLAALLGPTMAVALETVLKSTGVLIFWVLSGPLAAGMVVAYLIVLRTFRLLTRRADALVVE